MQPSKDRTLINELRLINILFLRGMSSLHDFDRTRVPSMSHMVVHYLIDRGGNVPQKDVETEFNLRRSTASELLGRLEQEGFITRVASESDGRSKNIILTQNAVEIHRQVADKFGKMERHIESAFTPDELETFMSLCDKLIARMSTPLSGND